MDRRTAVVATAVITLVLGGSSLIAPTAHAQTDEPAPPVAPIFAAQAPTPESLLTGMTSVVRAALAAAAESADATAAVARTQPAPSDFSISGVGTGHNEASIELTRGRLSAQVDARFGSTDVRFTADATAQIDMNVCPDERGLVRGIVRLEVTPSRDDDVPVAFGARTIEADFEGHVDDRARLTSFVWGNEDSTSAWTTETRVTTEVDDETFDETKRETTVVDEGEEGAAGGVAIADGRTNGEALGELIATAMRGARTIWRDSGCVSLEVLEGDSATIEPKEEVQIVLAPTSALDDRPVDLPVEGRFRNEGSEKFASLRPSRSTSSPAEFSYRGSDRRGSVFELVFRSVSRRGIAARELTFRQVGDLKPVFGRIGFSYSGVKCGGEPGGTWTIRSDVSGNGDPNGEDLTLEIDPDTLRGTVTGVRFFTQADQPTREIPIEGTVVYDPTPIGPQLVITRTTGPDLGTEYIGVNTGDFCENGKPRPGELVPIDR